MYIYRDIEISNPLYIHFLCGNKYQRKNDRDKRNRLKNYIDQIDNNYALILEQLFVTKEYTKMGFNNLEEVEVMASNYAKSIIIFQETVSTAAEISLFASKKYLKNKILVIYAPEEIVETDTVGSFIRLAYFNSNKITYKEYSFKRELNKQEGKEYAYYDTYFDNNELDSEFKNIINDFWKQMQDKSNIKLKKKKNFFSQENVYSINNKEKKIKINLNYNLILSLLISILINNELVAVVRSWNEAISKICKLFQEIISNTISNIEVQDVKSYTVSIKTVDNRDINLPIRFCVYILKKAKLIRIIDNKISVTNKLKSNCHEYKKLLIKINKPHFFEDDNNDQRL